MKKEAKSSIVNKTPSGKHEHGGFLSLSPSSHRSKTEQHKSEVYDFLN